MLRHAIAPTRRFTKVSHDLVRHRRLGSDAKLLVIYVQGLPESEAAKPLGEHADALGMKPRAFQRAKEELLANGFFHHWRWQSGRGLWITDQLLSNVTLTGEEASRVRDGVAPEPPAPPASPPPPPPPSAPKPTVGDPGPPVVVGSPPEEEDREKNTPHPPPEVVRAERVLLSLRHTNRDLWLGVREARGLADAAAEWLRRGFSTADLHHALTTGLPPGGVRSVVGFLRHRLVEKLPVPLEPRPAARPLVVCEGPGDDHVFRPVGDETHCGPCRQAAAASPPPTPRTGSWRTLAEQVSVSA
ncbi:hypothetical protein E2C00_10595 [Streptomyces sp. WAC05374]|uniref:hypothetical protein n=1 Tax=Streptomyces sp. WAC05374 TaxID=2487420 RepID=UPI000F875350|nr:hypothetical protein [Streptomyces sp. WAC05374]RST12466.1 hypothetical protein EF905_22635 [Streptomyces sp. WAC05374]TDF47222.1 hypothetical protein E2B92_09420 [Streptomyces sp. WAC05374]TDF57480.1 hypothetical protein E2C00_10595 [Streptomyces sp. WAC05374]TDF61585.1 hypothetical protein E2C02_01795 [Streptomyces sp. WAC05374]